MLKQVFQSVPFIYRTPADFPGWNPDSIWDNGYAGATVPPYLEGVSGGASWVSCLFSYYAPTKLGPVSLHVLAALRTSYWPSWNICGYRYDGVSGKILARFWHGSLGFVILKKIKKGSSGTIYVEDWYGSGLFPCYMSEFMTIAEGETPDYTKPLVDGLPSSQQYAWPYTGNGNPEIPAGFFKYANGGSMYAFGQGGDYAIDDVADVLIDSNDFLRLSIYRWSTGVWMYDIPIPDLLVSIAIEDPGRCFVTMRTGLVILIDYLRGEIMGSGQIPPRATGLPFWNQGSDLSTSWDDAYKRFLICDMSPDNPDGTSTTCIRGYRMVPEPTRLTLPIPLKKARQGRIVPVMTQIVGSMNEGVGGNVVTAVAGGSGSVIGVPVTNAQGVAIIQVACEGSTFYRPSPPDFDYEGTGSPDDPSGPSAGLIDITCTVTKYEPEKEILPPMGGGLITPQNPTGQHPLPPPADSGAPGTHSNPIIAMSSDPAQIHADVQSSWDHYHPIGMAHVPPNEIGSVDLWVGYCDHIDATSGFSNGKFYLGWNLYWESRMASKATSAYDTGAGNPEDASKPAIY